MRELIKPTLFLVARLGLFFGVASWFAGQWGPFRFWTSFGDQQSIEVTIGSASWTFKHFSFARALGWAKENSPDMYKLWTQGWEVSFSGGYESVLQVPGCDVFSSVGLLVVHSCHWLVVTIFALFNGVLIWVYRKRGKELVADE